MKRIYLDYASITPIDKSVIKEMNKYSTGEYSNPSALYTSAVNAKRAIESARERISKVINAHPDEIIFTSGGTESNDLVLRSLDDGHIIISAIEHSSIISINNAIKISVDAHGFIDLDRLEKSITPETRLVSVMLVNNEIGTIANIHDIAKVVRNARKKYSSKYPLLHTDACQAFMHIPIYIEKLGVDLISLDGNKIYGPRGVGVLYVKRGSVDISRKGTENVPAIMGMAYAIEKADRERDEETDRVIGLRDYFINEMIKINPHIKINGKIDSSSPHILNLSIPDIDNEFFVLKLDAQGIECSTKSACLRDEDESYVLKAIGGNSRNSVRFSFGRYTSKSDLKKAIGVIRSALLDK